MNEFHCDAWPTAELTHQRCDLHEIRPGPGYGEKFHEVDSIGVLRIVDEEGYGEFVNKVE
jgi:hypothetical protein